MKWFFKRCKKQGPAMPQCQSASGQQCPANLQATWQQPLPEDEIGRQQQLKERLQPGRKVFIAIEGVEYGMFEYSGVWDTLHTFYPLKGNGVEFASHRYCRRDLSGRRYMALPYTLLADLVTIVE